MNCESATSRCWAEIDLDALARNVESARALLNGKLLIPVLKGNAYGMGAVPVARRLFAMGLSLLAVATVDEGLELKAALPAADVLVMGPSIGVALQEAVEAGLILALFSAEQAEALSDVAARLGKPARVHLKLNTGLNRIGFDNADAMCRAGGLPDIKVEGMFTHLALRERASDLVQLDALRKAGIQGAALHALDSIGMVRYPEAHLDGVRLGAWLYGVKPKGYAGSGCEQIAALKARVAQVRQLPQGAYIGYDDENPLVRDSVVATISAGYADGCVRQVNTGYVQIRGKRAPVLGIVSMDQMMVDVTDIPCAQAGDVATLLGDSIPIDEYAAWQGLNRNDCLSRISRRVPRIYMRDGKPMSIASYFTACNEVNL